MEVIQSIQRAIAYMEDHILDTINYEDVARHVYMSNYHFHRIFSMMTGITANEYIRNRRLSMAGKELTLSTKKIIDIAFRYGYDSPESFTKAFKRFHGISPNAAKRSGMKLKLYNRLVIKIHLEGGTMIEYKIVERKPFQLLAKVFQFRNEIINEVGNHEIPDFWEKCGEEGAFEVLNTYAKNSNVYGPCAPISKESPCFDYGIGMEYDGCEVPEGFKIWQVKPTLWAVFSCVGNDGNCIAQMWERIMKEFIPGSDYSILDDIDFELYPENKTDGVFCEIWLPIEKK
jgi:AraC family transcriptional regulator